MNIDFFMNKALNQAYKALLAEEVPIGAVLVDNKSHKIISENHNLMNMNYNATHHAEMNIINDSCKKLKNKFPLYVIHFFPYCPLPFFCKSEIIIP